MVEPLHNHLQNGCSPSLTSSTEQILTIPPSSTSSPSSSSPSSTVITTNDDPDASQVQKFKLYKTRWLILSFALINELLNCLDRITQPINKIIYSFWGTDVDQVTSWSMAIVTTSALLTLPLGWALDRYGIKTMGRLLGITMLIGQLLLASTYLDEQTTFGMRQEWRFPVSIIAVCILVINITSMIGLNAKVANDWFPREQTTLALVIPGLTYYIFSATGSYIGPLLIKGTQDLYKLAYIYAASAIIYQIAAFTLIQRSKPKHPPSAEALVVVETTSSINLKSNLTKVLKNPKMVMTMLAYATNFCIYITQQRLLADILTTRGYNYEFCGQVQCVSCILGGCGSLLAAWLDAKAVASSTRHVTGDSGAGGGGGGQSVKVSCFAAIFYSITYVIFNCMLLYPNNHLFIMCSNITNSIAMALLLPLQLQNLLRSAKGMLPDASMVAINSLVGMLGYYIITMLYLFFKFINDKIPNFQDDSYTAPLLGFCCIISLMNGLYFIIIFPKQPTRLIPSQSQS